MGAEFLYLPSIRYQASGIQGRASSMLPAWATCALIDISRCTKTRQAPQ